MRPIWLPNLKKFMTGTTVGAKSGLDVNILNAAIPVVGASYVYKERRAHLPATTTINGSAGAWVELDVVPGTTGGAAVANDILQFDVNWNGAGMLEFGKGANSGAVTVIGAIGSGQTRSFGVSILTGNKVWVRSVKTTTVVDGELFVVLLG